MTAIVYSPQPATPGDLEELRRYVQTELNRIKTGFTTTVQMVGDAGVPANIDGGSANAVYAAGQAIDGGNASGV